jgi:hypothetical protein
MIFTSAFFTGIIGEFLYAGTREPLLTTRCPPDLRRILGGSGCTSSRWIRHLAR